MAWCHQATSHYLSQCWPRSLSPYGVTRSQWVKSNRWGQNKKEPLSCRWHFGMHLCEWKSWYFDLNFTEVCPNGPVDNKPTLIQKIAWCQTGDKPLSEPMMIYTLLTHILIMRARDLWSVKSCGIHLTIITLEILISSAEYVAKLFKITAMSQSLRNLQVLSPRLAIEGVYWS